MLKALHAKGNFIARGIKVLTVFILTVKTLSFPNPGFKDNFHFFMSESVTIAKKCTSPLAKSETAYRCQQYLRISAEYGKEWYCENGSWKSDITPPLTRERFWLCCALYEAGDSSLADAIIRTSRIIRKEYPFRSTFNIFNTNIATMLLLRHRTRMANDVVSLMEGMVRDGFASYAGNLAPDYQFHGYNDNMPAKALLGLILGGEMLGDSNAVKHGRWSLCQFADMLSRRGINSEYNSPTYTPLTIHALAELGEHALDPEVKKLALDLETHLWLDLASHFHPETGVVAGPYSRAYTVDVCAQVTALSSLLWFVLGESSLMSPMKLFDPNEKLILHHCGNRPFNIAQMCWYAAGVYHLNPALTDTFFNKAYPFSCVATAESGALGEGYPARPVRVETYMQPDFTLGTASTPFLDGSQSAPYFVTYRHQETVRSRTDIDTVFHKFLINDETPGRHEKEHPDYSNSDEQSHLDSHCHITTLQTENTAIVVTCPQTKLTDNGQQAPLKRVSECVLFSARSEGADELIVGTHERSSWEGVVPRGQWIYCRRGRLLIAIRPLVYMCGNKSRKFASKPSTVTS